jgi:hypothetical protein
VTASHDASGQRRNQIEKYKNNTRSVKLRRDFCQQGKINIIVLDDFISKSALLEETEARSDNYSVCLVLLPLYI